MAPFEPKSTELMISERAYGLTRVGSRAVDAEVEVLQRQGHTILPLKVYPKRPLPSHVVEAAVAAARDPHSPPSRGLPALREAISLQLKTEMSLDIDPDQHVLVTNGAMQALFVAFASLFELGDEILVPTPCFFLDGIADLLGVHLVYVPMDEARGYRWDHERLATAVTSHTRAIFVNTPVNPTGYVLTEEDLHAVTRLASKHGLWIIADESYDRMIYEGRQHLSALYLPEAQSQTVLIRSFTKSFAMPAWRVGYTVAPASVIDVMTKVFEWQCLYANTVCQAAAAAAIAGPKDWLADVAQEFQGNRDTFCRMISSTAGLTCVVPQGGPFVFVNVAGLGVDGDVFAHHLLYDFGMPSTPGSTLQSVDHVRVAFGGDPEVVDEASHRLSSAAKAMRKDG